LPYCFLFEKKKLGPKRFKKLSDAVARLPYPTAGNNPLQGLVFLSPTQLKQTYEK